MFNVVEDNVDLIDINDKNIMKQLCMKYKKYLKKKKLTKKKFKKTNH